MPSASYLDDYRSSTSPSEIDIIHENSSDPGYNLSDPPEGSFYQLMVPQTTSDHDHTHEEVHDEDDDGSDEISYLLGPFLLHIPESKKAIYLDIIVKWMMQPGRTPHQIVALLQRFTKPHGSDNSWVGISSVAALYLATALSEVFAELKPRYLTGPWELLLKFIIKHSNYIEYNRILGGSGSSKFKIWVIEALSGSCEFPDSFSRLEMVIFFNLFINVDNPHPFTWSKIVEVFVYTVSQVDPNALETSNICSLQLIVWKIENIIKYFHRMGYLTEISDELLNHVGNKFETQEDKFITTLLQIAGKLANLSLKIKQSGELTQDFSLLDNDTWFDLRVDLKQSLRIIELFTFIPAFYKICKQSHLFHYAASAIADITDAVLYYNVTKPIREHELDLIESCNQIVDVLAPDSVANLLPNLLTKRQYHGHQRLFQIQIQKAANITRLQVQNNFISGLR